MSMDESDQHGEFIVMAYCHSVVTMKMTKSPCRDKNGIICFATFEDAASYALKMGNEQTISKVYYKAERA